MKRAAALAAIGVALAACSGEASREFARYYDPRGFFTTNLPADNSITVTPPQPAQDGQGFFSGVISTPPAPSPTPEAGIGSAFNVAQTQAPDQTIYEAFAVMTSDFEDLSEMGLFYLTGDPAIDLMRDEPVTIDMHDARLVVVDVTSQGQTTASVAAAFTLGENGTGYLLVAIFPIGSWDRERGDFLRVLESFRIGVSPGLQAHPIVADAA